MLRAWSLIPSAALMGNPIERGPPRHLSATYAGLCSVEALVHLGGGDGGTQKAGASQADRISVLTYAFSSGEQK
jgi:hypothetical protein